MNVHQVQPSFILMFILTVKNHWTFVWVFFNPNRLLVFVVYVYTVSMFLLFYECRLISRKIIALSLFGSSAVRKGRSRLSVLPMNGTCPFKPRPSGSQIHSSVSLSPSVKDYKNN